MLEASVGLLWKNTTSMDECHTQSGDPKTQAHLLTFDLCTTGLSVCVPFQRLLWKATHGPCTSHSPHNMSPLNVTICPAEDLLATT